MKKSAMLSLVAVVVLAWLVSAESRAVELLVYPNPEEARELLGDIAGARKDALAARDACKAARDSVRSTWVPPQFTPARDFVTVQFELAACMEDITAALLKATYDYVAIIAILHPADPRAQSALVEANKRYQAALQYGGMARAYAAQGQSTANTIGVGQVTYRATQLTIDVCDRIAELSAGPQPGPPEDPVGILR